MKKYLMITLLLPMSLFAAHRNGVEVALPASWTEIPPKVMPMKNSYLFAPKEKSKAMVILQQVEFKPTFPDLKKEAFHQCRVHPEGEGQIIKLDKVEYCFIKKSEKALVFTTHNKKNYLSAFTFKNMSKEEVSSFMKTIGIK